MSAGLCVLGVPVGSLWLGAIFGMDPMFLGQTQNSVLLRLFPNISVMLEQIYVFQASRTDYTHTRAENNGIFFVCEVHTVSISL